MFAPSIIFQSKEPLEKISLMNIEKYLNYLSYACTVVVPPYPLCLKHGEIGRRTSTYCPEHSECILCILKETLQAHIAQNTQKKETLQAHIAQNTQNAYCAF